MTHKVIPRPSYLDSCIYLKVIRGRKVWQSKDGNRLYTWDSLHGEIEVFNKRRFHLGSIDAITGETIKPAVKGRRLEND